jgi:nucleoside-triphosphatase
VSKACNLLLTGSPGVGKTTVLAAVAQRLRDRKLGGFLTEEIRPERQRLGFTLVPFQGEPRAMAHRDLSSQHRVGRYGVDVETIDDIAETVLGPRADAEIFLIDEIGKMECFSRQFVKAILRLLDDPRPLVVTVALQGPGLISEVKQRTDVELWRVTTENRQQMPNQVTSWLSATEDSAEVGRS